jgi:hypothetical protein
MLARVRTREDPNLDPLASSWVTADQPFFGRTLIRKKMKTLLDDAGKTVLVVHGPEKSGKTYTAEWLDYLAAENRCDFRIVVEKLEKGGGPSITAALLADSLVSRMGRPRTAMPAFTPHRYEKSLCNWVVNEALQAEGRTWFVLDGFDDPNLDVGTAALIQELAGYLQTGPASHRVRLVLLDFRSKLVQVGLPRLEAEITIKPETVDSGLLKDCLRQHFLDIGQDVDDSFLDALATRLLSDADALQADPLYASEPRLARLNAVVYSFRQEELVRLGRI